MEDDDMKTVALHNDRSQYELVLAEKIDKFVLERQGKNDHLFDMFFAKPDFKLMLLHYLAGTYDALRAEVG